MNYPCLDPFEVRFFLNVILGKAFVALRVRFFFRGILAMIEKQINFKISSYFWFVWRTTFFHQEFAVQFYLEKMTENDIIVCKKRGPASAYPVSRKTELLWVVIIPRWSCYLHNAYIGSLLAFSFLLFFFRFSMHFTFAVGICTAIYLHKHLPLKLCLWKAFHSTLDG